MRIQCTIVQQGPHCNHPKLAGMNREVGGSVAGVAAGAERGWQRGRSGGGSGGVCTPRHGASAWLLGGFGALWTVGLHPIGL